MTTGRETRIGGGLGGFVVPGEFEEDEEFWKPGKDEEDRRMEERLARVEALQQTLVHKVPYPSDANAQAAERHREFQTLRDTLLDVKVGLARFRDVPVNVALRPDVDDVLRNQRHEFSYMRECLAWLRGAASAGAPVSLVSVSVEWNAKAQSGVGG